MSELDDIIRNEQAENEPVKDEQSTTEKTFDKEAWINQKKEMRANAFSMLETATTDMSNPEKFMQYLDVQSRFNRYSVSNALLVAHQMPEATKLRDAKAWNEAKVYIKKGNTGISILEPGKEYKREDGSTAVSYDAKTVFDVSQTTAIQKQTRPKTYSDKLIVKALVTASPVSVEIKDNLPDDVSAIYKSDEKVILVRQGMSGEDIFRNLAREIAYAQLDKGDYNRENCAVAAYGISYIACMKAGVNPSLMEKSDNLFKDMEPKEIRQELSKIRDESNSITLAMSKVLEPKNKDKDAR